VAQLLLSRTPLLGKTSDYALKHGLFHDYMIFHFGVWLCQAGMTGDRIKNAEARVPVYIHIMTAFCDFSS
jgi:hypothetical protein